MCNRTMVTRTRSISSGSDASDHFLSINERPVDDISLEFFYKPHTITLLIIAIIALIFFAFLRDETTIGSNIQSGIGAAIFFFLITSVLNCPNGPFTRPHPAFWRMVFGMSMLYMMLVVFILFQDYETARGIFVWGFPELENFTLDLDDTQWGQNCSLSFARVYQSLDFFAFAHLVGWMMKATLVRHYGILWTISFVWEITEMFFAHLLPNFQECWWDSLILDFVVCNGLGIWFGMSYFRYMEMRPYNWASIKDIRSKSGKLKRMVMQFTPMKVTAMRWLDPNSSLMRIIAVVQLVFFWQIAELNTFFLKHIFVMPPSHPVVFMRIFILGLMSAPSIRQYYSYVTDPRCKRLGTQCWIYMVCTFVEILISLKFGKQIFDAPNKKLIICWLIFGIVTSTIALYMSVLYYRASKAYRSKLSLATQKAPVNVDSDSDTSPYDNSNSSNVHTRRRVHALHHNNVDSDVYARRKMGQQ